MPKGSGYATIPYYNRIYQGHKYRLACLANIARQQGPNAMDTGTEDTRFCEGSDYVLSVPRVKDHESYVCSSNSKRKGQGMMIKLHHHEISFQPCYPRIRTNRMRLAKDAFFTPKHRWSQ